MIAPDTMEESRPEVVGRYPRIWIFRHLAGAERVFPIEGAIVEVAVHQFDQYRVAEAVEVEIIVPGRTDQTGGLHGIEAMNVSEAGRECAFRHGLQRIGEEP